MRVKTNVSAINSRNKLESNIKDLDRANRDLATGDRITQAAFDPSGLSISESMKSKIRSYGQAERNANDSISLIQTAEGGLTTIQSMAARMKELALQSANDTLSLEDRARVDTEFQQMKTEVKRVIETSEYNGRKVLDGSTGVLEFQVGIHNNSPGQKLRYDMSKLLRNSDQVSLSGASVRSKLGSQSAIPEINKMLKEVSGARAALGAIQARVQSVVSNIQVSKESTSSANSQIRDTDVAKAAAAKAISNIKTDASTASLAQSNVMGSRATQLI